MTGFAAVGAFSVALVDETAWLSRRLTNVFCSMIVSMKYSFANKACIWVLALGSRIFQMLSSAVHSSTTFRASMKSSASFAGSQVSVRFLRAMERSFGTMYLSAMA